MPEIKNTFLGGKMNKDLDERLIPKNEYRDALNVEVSTSAGDDVGTLQNTWGNTAQSNLTEVIADARVVGSVTDTRNEKIYWFINGSEVDAIVEYDLKSRLVSPVLVDFGMTDTYVQTFDNADVNLASSDINNIDYPGNGWSSGTPSANNVEGSSWNVVGGKAIAVKGKAGYLRLFIDEINLIEGSEYEIQYDITVTGNSGVFSADFLLANHGVNKNIRLDSENSGTRTVRWTQGDVASRSTKLWLYQSSILSTSTNDHFEIDNVIVRQVGRFLNFGTVDTITGINVLDGMLLWTDGVNEPKKINIDKCKAGSYGVSNFGSTSFLGDELLINGNFSISVVPTSWAFNGNYLEINSGVMATKDLLPIYQKIKQNNVPIKRGKTYEISVDLGGTFSSGAIGPVVFDDKGGWTKARSEKWATSVGTHKWTFTVGVDGDDFHSKPDYGGTPSRFYLQNEVNAGVNVGLTFDNVSVKEVAFDFNRTTKIKNNSGQYTKSIKEEDITLIKRYPLSAPGMQVINTVKPVGSVIKTSCFTPLNTTYNGTVMHGFADGSGDEVMYQNYIHLYCQKDVVPQKNKDYEMANSNLPYTQVDVGGFEYWNSIGTANNGSQVHQAVFEDPLNPFSVLRGNKNNPITSNEFTNADDYYVRAWRSWAGLNNNYSFHVWRVDSTGNAKGFSSGVYALDLIAGRIWIGKTASAGNWGADAGTQWKKGDRIVIGYWEWNNNHSFWTYKDSNGEVRVKPPGTNHDKNTDADGVMLLDDGSEFMEEQPLVANFTDKKNNFSNDFGGGWEVVDGKLISVPYVTPGDRSSSSDTTNHVYNTNGNLLPLEVPKEADTYGTDCGFQYLHTVVGGIVNNTNYYVVVRYKMLSLGNAEPNRSPFGISDRTAVTNKKLGSSLYHTAQNLVEGQTYTLTKHFGAEQSGEISFYKRDNVEVEVLSIQCAHKISNPVHIQPIVFSPKPDYEVGDLIKMTNTSKAPNGDDINVTVKLIEEIVNGSNKGKRWANNSGADYNVNAANNAVFMPRSWSDVVETISDMVDDSDFDNNDTYVALEVGADTLNSNSGNSADWTTSLNIFDYHAETPSDATFPFQYSPGDFTRVEDFSKSLHPTTGNWILNYNNSNGWIHSTAGSGTIEYLNPSPGTGNGWPQVYATAKDHPKMFFEDLGQYQVKMRYKQQVTGEAGLYVRLETKDAYQSACLTRVLAASGSGDVANYTDISQTITWDKTINNAWGANGGTIKAPGVNLVTMDDATATRFVESAGVAFLRVLTNNNVNRVSWGGSPGGCIVTLGNCSQVISYPRSSTGARSDGGTFQNGASVFELVHGEYYNMRYRIAETNYVDQDGGTGDYDDAVGAKGCHIRLFNHSNYYTTWDSAMDSHIELDLEVGTHEVCWQQKGTVNQFDLAFGPGFEGRIDDIKIHPVTVNHFDWGNHGSNDQRKMFKVEIDTIDSNLAQLPIAQHRNWECELVGEDPIFQRVFPRFAYRWKYEDGEYSAISAFTEVAFLPDNEYKYDAIEGYNLAMENTARRVILSNFDTTPSGVVAIDILYKESNSNNIYTLTTISGSEVENFNKYEVNKEKFHGLVESKQILRPYDNIPRKARAQEVSANRLIFGNYTQQYDITPSDEPVISTTLSSSFITASNQVSRSIKSIRDYQVGVSYLDAFGRQSPVFSNDNALLSVPHKQSATANTITAALENFPPDWVTHYKYYVKDSATSYYNISLDRFWQAEESSHVWLSFPSSDYNKVKEEDYIILKKQHNSDAAVIPSKTIKYKVLARKANAPSFIKVTREAVGGRIFNLDGKGLEFASLSSYGGTAAGYPQRDKLTFRIKGSIVHSDSNKAFKEAVIDDQTGRYVRIGQEIGGRPSLFSNYYEILHIARANNEGEDDDGIAEFEGEEDFYEFTLVKPLGFDASFIGDEYKASRKLFLEYYREETNENDNTFEGKFFIKIVKDTNFDRFVGSKQRLEDTGHNIVNAQDTFWAHAYESDSTKNDRDDRGLDTDVWLRDRTNFSWSVGKWSSTNTSGNYNGVGVTRFPASNDDTVDHGAATSNSVAIGNADNPYITTWAGAVHEADWLSTDGTTAYTTSTMPQRFSILSAFIWNWSSSFLGHQGQSVTDTNSNVGQGFIAGNDYCSFIFQGIGEVDLGDDATIDLTGVATAGSNTDTNTWSDGAEDELSSQWFDNYRLLQQLTISGTAFRWQDDPSNTIYTIKKVMNSNRVKTFDAQHWNGDRYGELDGKYLSKGGHNFGYRIDLQLDKAIVWSPTSTIVSGFGYNSDGLHEAIVPFKEGTAGTHSQIQILEKRPSESTYTSFNPAVFEIEPKERADLNLYYETPSVGMVLENEMVVEALNTASVNDYGAGGNYITAADVDTIYQPGGQPALPYALVLGGEEVNNGDFTDGDGANSVVGFGLNTSTGFTLTHDLTASTIKLVRDTTASDYPFMSSDLITLVHGQTYQVLIDVQSVDNNTNLGTYASETKGYVAGYNDDGSLDASGGVYRPVLTPVLLQGKNFFEFTHDSSATVASQSQAAGLNKVKIHIELPGAVNNKEIILEEISLKTIARDQSIPTATISTGKQFAWCNAPNQIRINRSAWKAYSDDVYDAGQDLPAGIKIRISKIDALGRIKYFKDYILNEEQNVSDIYSTDINIFLQPDRLKWHNCFAFGNGVESNRIRDDYNAVTMDKGPRVSTTLEETYREEKKGGGMIFSGIYNSTSSINQLNQFIQADSITKDLNPEYGSIQKLFTRNTNIVALCENKILKVLANKDALFNADGTSQVTSSSKVLGQAIPFVGEYGISRNPESFAAFGYRVYFTDRDRGAVLRLSNDGLTTISDKDMISYFKSNLPISNTMVGSYDESRDCYNLTLDSTTVSFSEKVNGWTSFKSFLPESGVSLNSQYYTFKNGDIWKHHVNARRNTFYGNSYESSVKLVFNDMVDEVKNFDTLNYEGSTSRVYKSSGDRMIRQGWYASLIKTDLESAEVINFLDKENKWFNSITGISKTADNIDTKDFTSQGLGITSLIGTSTHPNYKTLDLRALTPSSTPIVDAVGAGSGAWSAGQFYLLAPDLSETYSYALGVEFTTLADLTPASAITVESPNEISWVEHDVVANDWYSYYVIGVVGSLVNGNKYYIEADVEDFTDDGTAGGKCGFSIKNMVEVLDESTRNTNANGKIFTTFVYDDNKYEPNAYSGAGFGKTGEGIHFWKNAGTSGTVKNIKCINLTPKIDNTTYTVNTSATDRSQLTTQVKTDLIVGTNPSTIARYFYIHSQKVNNVNYAVTASNFYVESSIAEVTVGSLTDLGSGATGPGYHSNVVEIKLIIDYNSGSLFPNTDVLSHVSVSGKPTLSIDQ